MPPYAEQAKFLMLADKFFGPNGAGHGKNKVFIHEHVNRKKAAA